MHPGLPKVQLCRYAVVELHVSVLTIEICVQGHHTYNSTWIPRLGEELSCTQENGNNKDANVVIQTIIVYVECNLAVY